MQRLARLESIRYVLSQLDYADKDWTGVCRPADPAIVAAYDADDPSRAF